MKNHDEIDIESLYYNYAIQNISFASKGNLKFRLRNLFNGIDFAGKNFLEIGCGAGVYSFYVAIKGANKVVCLEPEAQGSKLGIIKKFKDFQNQLNINNISLLPTTFQDYNANNIKYDIILLYNSINHLDENACIHLSEGNKFKEKYLEIFDKLYNISNKGAKLIICDCSRYNLFSLLKIKGPFTRDIEWFKHWSPNTWLVLLKEVGYVNPVVKWNSLKNLRTFGKILFGNKIMSYFLNSHFCLKMEKPSF